MTQQHDPQAPGPSARDRQAHFRRQAWGGLLIGFALGGFFDGILLHQILQWHHLLSGMADIESLPDLRFQIMMDGLFHLLHYIMAVIGAVLLWLPSPRGKARISSRHLMGWALIGFGGWHGLDAVVAHWALQLHRIRMDVDNPLLWDLIWFVPFGLGALAAGFWLLNMPPGPRRDGREPGASRTAAGLVLTALLTAPVAARPPADIAKGDRTLVVFRPGLSFAQIEEAVEAAGGRLVWTDIRQSVWLVAHEPDQAPFGLYLQGAVMMSRGPVSLGCLSWTET
jgi:uncharacterized membrane protein